MGRKSIYPPSVKPGIPRLGIQPPGWQRVKFGDILTIIQRPVAIQDGQEYQLVTAKRSRGGIVARERLRGEEIKTKKQYLVRAGDFLISNRQIIHGACGIVPPDLDGAIVSGEYTVLLPKSGLCLDYLGWFSHSTHFQQTCFHSSVGVDVEKMVFDEQGWLNHELYLPDQKEQERIVRVLSTWEKGLCQISALSSAKRTLAVGLMQQLLSGNRRLPGYSKTPWHNIRLNDILQEVSRPVECVDDTIYQLVSVRRRSGGLFFREPLPGAEIKTKNLFMAKAGDFLISKMQAVHGATGLVTGEFDGAIISGSYVTLTVKDTAKLDMPFFNVLSQTPIIHRHALESSHGVHIEKMTFSVSDFLKKRVRIPSHIEEQRKIAAILDTSDREIRLLEDEGELLHQQKQVLIQKLLSGEIRVPLNKEV